MLKNAILSRFYSVENYKEALVYDGECGGVKAWNANLYCWC